MSADPTPLPDGEPDEAPRRSWRWPWRRWAWTAARVVLIAGLLLGGLALLGVFAVQRHEAYRPPANAFLIAWREGDREAMWREVGARWRVREPREDFEAWQDELLEWVGPLRGAKVVDARTGREAGVGKFHRLTFEARFERARGRMLVTLMEQPGGGWAVEGALLESIIMDP